MKASDSIRKKYRELKRGAVEEEETIQKQLEPLVTPLKTLVEHSKVKKEKTEAEYRPKKEEKEEPVFESVEDDDETAARDETSWEEELHKWKKYLSQFGPRAKKYIDGLVWDRTNNFDTKFGVRIESKDDAWKIGTKKVWFEKNDDIKIGEEIFPGTPGLYELIFMKDPDKRVFEMEDLLHYKRILELSSAHFQQYNPEKRIASSQGAKYKNIISKLFSGESVSGGAPQTSGGRLLPVNDNKIDYIHWNDVNELVDRLAELHAALAAGNKGVLAEIASIEEELREADIIE